MRDMDDIRAFCTEFRKLMEHAPGGEWLEVDDQAWNELIGLCKRISDRGTRFRSSDRKGWSPEAWQVFFFIRNSEFRPKWDKLEQCIREKFKMQVMAGHEADMRREVRMPREDPRMAIEAPKQRMLGQSVSDDGIPAWLGEFPSRDNGGAFDQVLLRPMMHLSDHEARKVCRIIREQNEQHEREKAMAKAEKKRDTSEEDRLRNRLRNTVVRLQKGMTEHGDG